MAGVLVGGRLRAARKAADMSQQQLADVIGTHVMVISAWERDTRAPNGDSLDAIAGALGVSVDYLLGRTDDPAGVIAAQSSALSVWHSLIHEVNNAKRQ